VGVCNPASSFNGLGVGFVFATRGGMRSSRQPRGYSLFETLTALVVVGLLTALSISALSGIKNRGLFSSGSGDLIGALRRTRSEAYSRGSPCVFVIDTSGGRWWSIADSDNNFSLATFNPSTPAPSPDVLLASGTLPSKVTFGPGGSPGGYGKALPAPYAGVPSYQGATPAPNFPYCSFCNTGAPNANFGAITFFGSGGAAFSGGTGAPIGHQFTIQTPQASGSGMQVMTFAVVARTGTAETFETTK